MDARDLEVVELGLRLAMNLAHDHACTARLERRSPSVIERLDKKYESVLETYRRVIGKDPLAD